MVEIPWEFKSPLGQMYIINARWTPMVNYLLIKCECGYEWWHRADRRKIVCDKCLTKTDCHKLKAQGVRYVSN